MKEIVKRLKLSDKAMAYIMNKAIKDTADLVYGCISKRDQIWDDLEEIKSKNEF